MSEATTAPIVKTANDLSVTIETIQHRLAVLLQTPYNEVSGRLKASDRAKFQIMLAYTLNSLFWVYLKMQGDAPEKHSVKRELDRIRAYIVKIQETENPPKPTMTIDKEAAARFIKHNLPKLVEKSQADEGDNNEVTPSHSQDEATEGNPKKHKTEEDSTSDNETSKSTRRKKKNKSGASKRKAKKAQNNHDA